MLVVVRHGQTAWNAEGRFQGWADVPLDDEGWRQSEQAAVALADLVAPVGPVGHERLVTVVSSDLRRAADTARTIARAMKATVMVDPQLREVDVGHWEGLTRQEASERFPAEYRAWATGRDVRRGGGETLSDAGARVAAAIRSHRQAAPGDLVVVGHGMSLQAALTVLAGEGLVSLDGGAPHLGNAEYLVLQDWRHDQNERLLSER